MIAPWPGGAVGSLAALLCEGLSPGPDASRHPEEHGEVAELHEDDPQRCREQVASVPDSVDSPHKAVAMRSAGVSSQAHVLPGLGPDRRLAAIAHAHLRR